MQEHDDINIILGAALVARGLTPQQSMSLIQAIAAMLRASEYYMTREQHEDKIKQAADQIAYYLETIEAYRARERQCVAGGCADTTTTEKVLLPILEADVYLCNLHRKNLMEKEA